MTEQLERIEVVYLGHVILQGNKEGVLIAPRALVDADPEKARSVASPFEAKKSRFLAVGNVYSCEAVIGDGGRVTTYRPATVEFVGPYSEGNSLPATWQAENEAVKLTLRAKSREKTLAADTALTRQVDALRRTYQAIPYSYRPAFKLWLLEQLGR